MSAQFPGKIPLSLSLKDSAEESNHLLLKRLKLDISRGSGCGPVCTKKWTGPAQNNKCVSHTLYLWVPQLIGNRGFQGTDRLMSKILACGVFFEGYNSNYI